MMKMLVKVKEVGEKGGPHSGNFNHKGIPGSVGGSMPGGMAAFIGKRDSEGNAITVESFNSTAEYLADNSGVKRDEFDNLDYLSVGQYAQGKIDGPKAIKQLQQNQQARIAKSNQRSQQEHQESSRMSEAAATEAVTKMTPKQRALVDKYRREGSSLSDAVADAIYDSQAQPMTRSERGERTVQEERTDRRIRRLIR